MKPRHFAWLIAIVAFGATEASTRCLPDNTHVTIVGVIQPRHGRDRRTSKPYTYTVLKTDSPYCISGEDVDYTNSTPTRTLPLTSNAKPSDDSLSRKYMNRPVIVRGKLVSTNGGGPELWYDGIIPKP